MFVTDKAQLRLSCEPVRSVKEGGEVARKLWAALSRNNKKAQRVRSPAQAKAIEYGNASRRQFGLGLSAPQIGIRKQVCVFDVAGSPVVLMNPVVVGHSAKKIPFTESCLSFPDVAVDTYRFIWVEVETINVGRLSFGPRTPEAWNMESVLSSVVCQHEIDHLLGILMEDRTEDLQRDTNTYPSRV